MTQEVIFFYTNKSSNLHLQSGGFHPDMSLKNI